MQFYSCITSLKYLNMIVNHYSNSSINLIIFTNNLTLTIYSSEKFFINYIDFIGNDFEFSRYIKMQYIPSLNNYPKIYIDSTVYIKDINIFKSQFIENLNGTLWFKHPRRNSATKEVIYLFFVSKINFLDLFKYFFKSFILNRKSTLVIGGLYIIMNEKGLNDFIEWRKLYKYFGIPRDQPALAYTNKHNITSLTTNVIIKQNFYKINYIIILFIKLKKIIIKTKSYFIAN
jgi:hypothetical protein